MTESITHRMSDTDALMWTIERDPLLRSTITAVIRLDATPDRARLRRLIEGGTRQLPRMRHRVRGNPYSLVPPRWEVDPNFDLDFHLRWVSGGGAATMRDVLDYAQPIAMQSFDRARPQWEIHVIDGLDDGGAAMIAKIHHAITDGVGAVAMAMVLFDLERDPADGDAPLPPAPEPDVMNPVERLVDGVRHGIDRERETGQLVAGGVTAALAAFLRDPGTALRQGGAVAASAGRLIAPATRPKSTLMAERSLKMHFDTISVPLAAAKAAARVAEGRLNDAFVAATTLGLRRYHEAHGASTGTLRMAMPINLRHDEGSVGGNHFVPARFDIPLVIDDPVERMRSVHELVARQRAEPALDLVDPMAGVLNRLPRSVTTEVFGSVLRGVDFVTSNVPGAPIELFSAGAKVTDMYAFAPLSGAAVNVTLLSYVDTCHVAVNSDRAAVPDPDRLIACLREGWDEILAVTDDRPVAIAT
jgi:WS/DGAT/MGAT family acyltransferase